MSLSCSLHHGAACSVARQDCVLKKPDHKVLPTHSYTPDKASFVCARRPISVPVTCAISGQSPGFSPGSTDDANLFAALFQRYNPQPRPTFPVTPPETDGLGMEPQPDDIWLEIRREARHDSEEEPTLASYLYSTVLSHRSLERALAFHLANKLQSSTLLASHLSTLFTAELLADGGIQQAIRADLRAVRSRDPACSSFLEIMLNFKGFLACQTHRIAHRLWLHGRHALALALQSRVSEVFHVDIHPAAQIGYGILFDHATGVVIGETARIGNNVSMLHQVTLGGTGAMGGGRHPTIGDGVLIGAGAILLGPIVVGHGAKIGSGSVVLADVRPGTTVVGNPAREVGKRRSEGKGEEGKKTEDPSETMDHVSAIIDYMI